MNLIAPEWPSSYFWPTLCSSGHFKSFVKQIYAFKPFYHSNCDDTIFKGFVKFNTLALYLALYLLKAMISIMIEGSIYVF